MGSVNIGTAGWSIPRQVADRFPREGTALERYASRFPVVEINSSFHRPHRLSTWARWRDTTPATFRFSDKVPKIVTHQRKLVDCAEPIAAFVEQAATLGSKLAVLLVQLPPKLAFDAALAEPFFAALAARSSASIACEPRHPSWFTGEVDRWLERRHIARVAADPALCEEAARPGGWRGLGYWRLHGSPAMYRSSYADRIGGYAEALRKEAAAGHETWCLFDNTASSAAASDALALTEALA
jgi:uncharacterized protein YecE (DUF72 family)